MTYSEIKYGQFYISKWMSTYFFLSKSDLDSKTLRTISIPRSNTLVMSNLVENEKVHLVITEKASPINSSQSRLLIKKLLNVKKVDIS
jgi:hypothetical protein